MSRAPFTSRSTGVLFWGAGYLVVAIAFGSVLALLWPQGRSCVTSCGDRIEASAVAYELLLVGGAAGFAVAVGLGIARRPVAPRWLIVTAAVLLVAALAMAVALDLSSSSGEADGLAAVRAAWSWSLAVPASALLATSLAARLRHAAARQPRRSSARVRRA
jgi:hypothetical protein